MSSVKLFGEKFILLTTSGNTNIKAETDTADEGQKKNLNVLTSLTHTPHSIYIHVKVTTVLGF